MENQSCASQDSRARGRRGCHLPRCAAGFALTDEAVAAAVSEGRPIAAEDLFNAAPAERFKLWQVYRHGFMRPSPADAVGVKGADAVAQAVQRGQLQQVAASLSGQPL